MKKKILILGLVLLFSGAAAAIWFKNHPAPVKSLSGSGSENSGNETGKTPENIIPVVIGQNIPAGALQISEPATYKNLQVFFIYSQADIRGERYVTLDDALKGKLITVRETGEVNELKIDNKSSRYIYLNSGDIVRGGKQDRTIQYDVVIAPKMRNVDLASFCVEHDRWSNRGDESVQNFSSSKNSLSSKELKVAAKLSKDQSEVWEKVGKYQEKTNGNLSHSYGYSGSVDVKSQLSESSLELTLENKEIGKIKEEYRKHIIEKFTEHNNAVGIACFINGKISSIDIYNNHALFEDLLDKLLDAAIAEAISENAVKKYTAADTAMVYTYIRRDTKELSTEEVNKVTRFSVYKTDRHIMMFLTEDKHENKWLHKNWLDTREE